MKHPKAVEIEDGLKKIFDKIDDQLEDKYGSLYVLHPARAERGTTANKSYDGLFNVGAKYSAGYGSKYGKGYVVDVNMSTLKNVPEEIKKTIQDEVINILRKELDLTFPKRDLNVDLDGNVYKIYGDLNLGFI